MQSDEKATWNIKALARVWDLLYDKKQLFLEGKRGRKR